MIHYTFQVTFPILRKNTLLIRCHTWTPWITHAHHITSCRHKHRTIGSLSESGGRGGPAMTAGGFNQRLTGGGEATRLIDCRQRLCIQGCCCRRGLQLTALIWWCLAFFPPSVLCSSWFLFFSLSFIQSPSSSPPFTLLITPSFYLPCCRSFSLINIFHYEGSEPSL